ncbi:hypothetical protein AKJ49_00295 [candidate division MSBL1 archaeon SCGC-AAA382A03]|nr:hypothetical protein AKJ49_00295 [candidate division MSBL1 archaeon SCGC-AAA382A03]
MNAEENEKDFSPKKVRKELILYLLREYGNLKTKEIAKVLGYEPRTIRRSLKKLRESGKVEADKLGKGYIWSHAKGSERKLMYF